MIALLHGPSAWLMWAILAAVIPSVLLMACLTVGGRADEVLLRQEQTEADRDALS